VKKYIVTSCSHSHGWRSERVTMSHTTVTVKPLMAMPHRIMRTASRGSSHRHFRWRWSSRTRVIFLLDAADQAEHLDRVRAEVARDLVLHRRGDLLEAGLVHVDELDAHLRELRARLGLHLEGLLRLLAVELVGGALHPFLLLGGEARPELVAHEEHRVVRLVLAHRHHRRDLVVLVDAVHGIAVLRAV